MVNGIFTIPLTGHFSGPVNRLNSTARPLPEFIAGPENLLAATALRPYLDRSATDSNLLLLSGLLVLYGPHGSGKSHLAQGLAEWWRHHYPNQSTTCLSGSEFAQAYAQALDTQSLELWRQQIRGADLFVLEDLGQLVNKRGAQEELQHTLDALADRQALVVATARTLPAHSSVLSAALRSRFSAGLAVPLSLPGPATRRAILEKLAAARGLSLPKRAMHSLADGLAGSVPAILAALLELELKTRLSGKAVDQDGVLQFVAERENAKMPSLRDIAGLTAKYFGLTLAELKSPARRQPLVAARGVAMVVARQLTNKSLEQVGAFFGGRDHTTVLHACRRTEKLCRRDQGTRQAITELKRLLTVNA